MTVNDARSAAKSLLGKRAGLAEHLPLLRARCEELQDEIGRDLPGALCAFSQCECSMDPMLLDAIALNPNPPLMISVGSKAIDSVVAPTFSIDGSQSQPPCSYGMAQTTVRLDGALAALMDMLPKLVELAEKQKACELIRTKMDRYARRAHALERIAASDVDRCIGTASAFNYEGK